MWFDLLDRQDLVELAYQKGNKLNLDNDTYLGWLNAFFEKEYLDDLGQGDLTSKAILTKNEPKIAILKTKASGIISGLKEVNWFLRKHGLDVKLYKKDGNELLNGEPILEIRGRQKDILATERIALNVLQRMSGISTETKRLVNLLKDYNTRIAATRKTVLRYLDKKAVFLGGGLTHRFGLWDSILIKNNHLETLKRKFKENYIKTALARASLFSEKVDFIEIEVTSTEDAIHAARSFKSLTANIPYAIMLDNMFPSLIDETLETLRKKNLYDFTLFEASGAITPENIQEYAKTGVDVISLGYLTHSVHALDMNLEMKL
jgi:nicotinate-nucleotide pyrophosphorylase (carboxylating)